MYTVQLSINNQIINGRKIKMKDYIRDRALDIANYVIDSGATIRKTARVFGVSKSTVHKDVTERLPRINPVVANEAKHILDMNKLERHIRGGRATQIKYMHLIN
jgi:putative DeoR family transcriptional regulator (stage III sporulation protein D)